MKKVLSLVLMVCLVSGIVKAQENKEAETKMLAPGAVLSLYSHTENGLPAAGADPLEVVLDNSEGFSRDNLRKYDDTKAHHNAIQIIVWEGYLNIPADGEYVFSGKSFNNSSETFSINGKKVLVVSSERNEVSFSGSKSLRMKQGDYKVQVFLSTLSYRSHFNDSIHGSFTLQYWNKSTPIKKTPVTPASLFHEN